MELLSTAFSHHDFLPTKYICDGENISPELHWTNIPPGTQSLVLIYDDPDGVEGLWTHWVLFNLPNDINSLRANIQQLPKNIKVGINSWDRKNYGGLCPPYGSSVHRYTFLHGTNNSH